MGRGGGRATRSECRGGGRYWNAAGSVVGGGPDVSMSDPDVPRDAVSASRSLSTFIFGFRWCIILGYGKSRPRDPPQRTFLPYYKAPFMISNPNKIGCEVSQPANAVALA